MIQTGGKYCTMKSQNGVFGIAKDYGLDIQGVGVRFLTGARDFPLLHSIQTETWGPLSLLYIEYCRPFSWDG
jgi:hypothetical protein